MHFSFFPYKYFVNNVMYIMRFFAIMLPMLIWYDYTGLQFERRLPVLTKEQIFLANKILGATTRPKWGNGSRLSCHAWI